MTAVALPEPPDLPEVDEPFGEPAAPSPDTIPHGVHAGVPERLYHGRKLGLVSKSVLDLLHRSPMHYKAWVDGCDEPPTPAMIFGSAFHCAVLEPDKFARRYVVEPNFGDCRFKENKARRDEWRRDNAGREQLSGEDMVAIRGMSKAIYDDPYAGRMLRDGQPELTVRWRDEETGLECKLRTDYYVERLRALVDVKSTDDASDEGFARSCAKFGYHRQDAFYRRGFAAIGQPVDHFVFLAVEKRPPYAVAVYALDEESVGRGAESIAKDMATMAECLRTGQWPGYGAGIRVLKLPRWAD